MSQLVIQETVQQLIPDGPKVVLKTAATQGPPGPDGRSAKQVLIDEGVLAPETSDTDFALWLTSGNTAAAASAAAAAASLAALVAWTPVAADHQVVVGERIKTDSSAGAFNLTLPAAPTDGNQFEVFDAVLAWGLHAVTLKPNGHKIRGQAADYPLNASGGSLMWVFTASTDSWEFIIR